MNILIYYKDFGTVDDYNECVHDLIKKNILTAVHRRLTSAFINCGFFIYLPGNARMSKRLSNKGSSIIVYQQEDIETNFKLQSILDKHEFILVEGTNEMPYSYYLGCIAEDLGLHAFFIRRNFDRHQTYDDVHGVNYNDLIIIHSKDKNLAKIRKRIVETANQDDSFYYYNESLRKWAHNTYEVPELHYAQAIADKIIAYFKEHGSIPAISKMHNDISKISSSRIRDIL